MIKNHLAVKCYVGSIPTLAFSFIKGDNSLMKFIDELSDEEFIKIVKSSHYLYEVGNKIGYSTQTTYKMNDIIKNRMIKLNVRLDSSKDIDYNYYSNNTYHTTLNSKLVSDNIIDYMCALCGNPGTWSGKTLSLQVDHIDGDASNNEIANLRFLCPNCHSQTDTYGNKNKMKRTSRDRHSHYNRVCKQCGKNFITNGNRQVFCSIKCASDSKRVSLSINKEELENEIKTYGFSGTGKIHGVSDKSIRKWCLKLGMPTKKSFYK